MIRGTTAQFKFDLPYRVADVTTVKISFWQENYSGPDKTRPLPIVKVLEQCSQTTRPDELLVFLNKEETLRFITDRKAYVQLHGKTKDGTAFGSKKKTITVYPVYDDSILDDDVDPTPTPGDNGLIVFDGSTVV